MQRIGTGQSFPWFLDSAFCTGVILHGICNSTPELNSFSFPGMPSREVRLDFVYLVAGYSSYLSGLALAPYQVIYVMAAIGLISFASRIVQRRNREKGELHFGSRKHWHRHWEKRDFPWSPICHAAWSFRAPTQSSMILANSSIDSPIRVRCLIWDYGWNQFAVRITTCNLLKKLCRRNVSKYKLCICGVYRLGPFFHVLRPFVG